MTGTNPTFGCGAFLPGYGPNNFPDFDDTNGNTKGPNGGSQNPADPPGGVPGGRGDPDPECKCRTIGTFSVVQGGGPGGPGGQQAPEGFVYYTLTAEQRCTFIVNGLPVDESDVVINDMRAAVTQANGTIVFQDLGNAGAECEGEGSPTPNDPCAEKTCPDLVIVYRVRTEKEVGGPTSPPPRPTETEFSPTFRVYMCKITSTTGPTGGGTGGQVQKTWRLQQTCTLTTTPGEGQAIIQSNASEIQAAKDLAEQFAITNNIGLYTISVLNAGSAGKICGGGVGCGDISVVLTWTTVPPPDPPSTGPPPVIVGEDPGDPGGYVITPIGDQTGGDPPVGVGDDPGDPGGTGTTPIGDQTGTGSPVGVGEDPGDPGGTGTTPIGDQTGTGSPVGVGEDPGDPGGTPIEDQINSSELSLLQNQSQIGEEVSSKNTLANRFNFLTNRTQVSDEAVNSYFAKRSINLSDPLIERTLLASLPAGLQDPEIVVSIQGTESKLVPNTAEKGKRIFADKIDSTLLYLLKTSVNSQQWDSTKASSFSTNDILRSLQPNIRNIITSIKSFEGSLLTYDQIFSLIGSRVLDDTIDSITPELLQDLLLASNNRETYSIIRSKNNTVNEIAALKLIESNYFPLDYSAAEGLARNTLKSYKSFASDVDRFIEVQINGESTRYYVNDDDTFIRRSSLSLQDGEFFDVVLGGETERVYAQSESDHAFIIPENVRQSAIKLLGGDTNKLLSVSSLATKNIETSYSLSSPRENFYFLSCVLDTVKSTPKIGRSRLLSRTKATYKYVPIETEEDLIKINEFIKFKSNYETYVLNEEDLIFDYITSGSLLSLEQDDIIYEAPKENKTNPLLIRQLPRYLIVYPTNRQDFLVFNDKSTIIEFDPSAVNFDGEITSSGLITRQLVTNTNISSKFNKKFNSQFVKTETAGREALNVFGTPDTQTRIQFLDPEAKVYKEGYRTEEGDKEIKLVSRTRKLTSFRLAVDILTEMDNNYSLGKNGVGKSVTEFDLFSRFNLREFNIFTKSSDYEELKKSLFSGAVRDIKVVPAIKSADARISLRKTQLILRKNNAPQDVFLPTKTTASGKIISPPTEEEPPKETPPPAVSPRPVTP